MVISKLTSDESLTSFWPRNDMGFANIATATIALCLCSSFGHSINDYGNFSLHLIYFFESIDYGDRHWSTRTHMTWGVSTMTEWPLRSPGQIRWAHSVEYDLDSNVERSIVFDGKSTVDLNYDLGLTVVVLVTSQNPGHSACAYCFDNFMSFIRTHGLFIDRISTR